MGVMDDANFLPNDLAACQRLLLAAFQQSVELEHQVADAQRQAAEAKQQATELSRVLDETAASYQELQQAHAATLDELAWYRRWTFGRRRERFAEDEGQGHLFELDSPLTGELPVPTTPDPEAGSDLAGHIFTRRLASVRERVGVGHHDGLREGARFDFQRHEGRRSRPGRANVGRHLGEEAKLWIVGGMAQHQHAMGPELAGAGQAGADEG